MTIQQSTTNTKTLNLGSVGKIYLSHTTPGALIKFTLQERDDGSKKSSEVFLTVAEIKQLSEALTAIAKEVEEFIAAVNKEKK